MPSLSRCRRLFEVTILDTYSYTANNSPESADRMPPVCTKSPSETADDIKLVVARVREICETTGIVGLSATVIHRGETILQENIGYRDLEKKEPVTSDTIFPIGALTQSFTAACVGMKRLNINDMLADDLYKNKSKPDPSDKTRVYNLLTHSTGRPATDHKWLSCRGDEMVSASFWVRIFSHLEIQSPPQTQFGYNGICYAVLASLIEKYIGSDVYALFLEKKILVPLEMTRTLTSNDRLPSNSSLLYGVMDDGQPHKLPFMEHEGYFAIGGSIGNMMSTANDLAKWCKALNSSWSTGDRTWGSAPWCPSFPLQPIGEIKPGEEAKKSYGSGWAISVLPSSIGDLGINPELIEMPILAAGSGVPVRMVWNQGKYPGTSCFVAMLPDYQSAVIVLGNTMTANDATDWIGQLLIHTLLDSPYNNDYCFLASVSADSARQRYHELANRIKEGKESGGPSRPLDQYRGCYKAKDESTIYITRATIVDRLSNKGSLTMSFLHNRHVEYALKHHHGDTFTWFMPWNERVKKGRAINYNKEFHFIHFQPSGDDKRVISLTWHHDPTMPKGDVYRRLSKR